VYRVYPDPGQLDRVLGRAPASVHRPGGLAGAHSPAERIEFEQLRVPLREEVRAGVSYAVDGDRR